MKFPQENKKKIFWIRAGKPKFDVRQNRGVFLFSSPFRPAVRCIKPSVQCVFVLAPHGKLADPLRPSDVNAKNIWMYISIPHSLQGMAVY
jgi:hypothetical protein